MAGSESLPHVVAIPVWEEFFLSQAGLELTTKQTAEALGVSVEAVRKLAKAGKLKAHKDGQGRYVIDALLLFPFSGATADAGAGKPGDDQASLLAMAPLFVASDWSPDSPDQAPILGGPLLSFARGEFAAPGQFRQSVLEKIELARTAYKRRLKFWKQ